ncbi:Kelch repeat-containing protein [Micromonospora inositola]|uniref:hypothetical protein n=1 Tax=Micromonospora inositola TaxID=47865 RepID=UPI0012FD9C21|nr:hypothetical protein [Micromonospora inositola]
MMASRSPTTRIKGTYSPLSLRNTVGSTPKAGSAAPNSSAPAAAPWTTIADYPSPIQDNGVVSLGGKIYSAFGVTGSDYSHAMYAYDPTAGSWSRLASPADDRQRPTMAVLNGKIYATGGWGRLGR